MQPAEVRSPKHAGWITKTQVARDVRCITLPRALAPPPVTNHTFPALVTTPEK